MSALHMPSNTVENLQVTTTEPFPVSAYVGSSKNLKDLPKAGPVGASRAPRRTEHQVLRLRPVQLQDCGVQKGKRTPLGPYSRPMPVVLQRS